MRVFLRITVGMMHPVKNGIGPGIQKRGSLGEKGETIKKSLPKLIHFEHLMRSVPMQEECLCK